MTHYSYNVLIEPSLVGYWKFDEASGTTFADSSGKGVSGTLSGTVTLNNDGIIIQEPANRSIRLGSSGIINLVYDGAKPLFQIVDEFTFEGWVYDTDTCQNTNTKHTLFSFGATNKVWIGLDSGNHVGIGQTASKNYLVIRSLGNVEIACSSAEVTINAWHHIAVTKKANVIHLYLDGVDVTGTISNNYTFTAPTTDLHFGKEGTGGTYILPGNLDEFAVYNKALLPLQILAHYNNAYSPNITIDRKITDKGIEMLQELPDNYWEDPYTKNLMMTEGIEIDLIDQLCQFPTDEEISLALANDLSYDINGIISGWFARLATDPYLSYWELMLGIPIDTALSNTIRRNRLLNKMQHRNEAVNEDIIERHLLNIGVVAKVTYNPTTYAFVVRVYSPLDSAYTPYDPLVHAIIDSIKPANLTYTITFEATWINLGSKTWVDIGTENWSTLS